MNKNDLRVVKTRKALYVALIDLMKELPFEEIKVSDICSKALVNRSTFYAHYEDKYELFQEFIKELKNSLELALLANKNINNIKEYYMEMLKLFLNHIDEKRDIYLAVIANNKNSITIDIIYDVLNQDVTKRIAEMTKENKPHDIPVSFIAKFYLGAVFTTGTEWLNSNSKYSKNDIISYLDKLIPDSINDL